MLKAFAPLVLLLVAGISFFFLDGWPLATTVEEGPEPVDNVVAERGAQVVIPTEEEPLMRAPEGDSEPSKGIPLRSDEATGETVASVNSGILPLGSDHTKTAERLARLKTQGGSPYRKALSEAVLDKGLERVFREKLLPELRRVNRATILGQGASAGVTTTKVRGGDSLIRIARRVKKAHGNNATAALIQRMNGMTNTMIRPGQMLRVPTGKLSVLIHVEEYRLFVLLDGQVVLDYPVGTGKNNSTPFDSYNIRGKTKRANWTMPDGKVVKFGDPRHIIGSRWMGFDKNGGRTGYGIHGTVDDSSIGKQASEGCIRMRRADVEALFELIPEGCPVVVKA